MSRVREFGLQGSNFNTDRSSELHSSDTPSRVKGIGCQGSGFRSGETSTQLNLKTPTLCGRVEEIGCQGSTSRIDATSAVIAPGINSQTVPENMEGTSDHGDLLSKLVGSAPVITCKLNEVPVRLLVDSGSSVTTVSEAFFNQHLRGIVSNPVDGSRFLKLRAANGLECPYIGYVIMEIDILGKTLSKEVLVQRDEFFNFDG